nr:MAG TPA: hypothetical protein [Bacteriophage sp.]
MISFNTSSRPKNRVSFFLFLCIQRVSLYSLFFSH